MDVNEKRALSVFDLFQVGVQINSMLDMLEGLERRSLLEELEMVENFEKVESSLAEWLEAVKAKLKEIEDEEAEAEEGAAD